MFATAGISNIYFFLAALPVQLIILFFYMNHRQLPLRESRSFLYLMAVNTAVLLLNLLLMCVNPGEWPSLTPWLVCIFFSAMFLDNYLLFCYFCDALKADEYGGKWVKRITFLPVAAGILYFLPKGGQALAPGDMDAVYSMLKGSYLIFYAGLSLFLVWLRRKENSFRRNVGFVSSLLIVLAGAYVRFFYPQVLFGGYFYTLAVFIIYLTVRNPDFYVEHQTHLLNKAAFQLVADDRIESSGIHGFGFVIKDYEEGRILYGGPFIDSFLDNIGHYLQKEFGRGHAFYLDSGRFFILYRNPVSLTEETDRLHRRFRNPWTSGERSAYFDICCCLLEKGLHFESTDELVQVVSSAFDAAHRLGQEDFTIGEEYLSHVKRQVYVRRLLKESLDRDSLQVYLQPIVLSSSGKPEGAEALVRLSDHDGSIISPAEFIPAAESSGAVTVLGLQVFRKVCDFIKQGGMEKCGMQWINVNVSPVQCLGRDLPEKLESIRKAYNVPRSFLHLEITEQGALGPGGLSQIERLRRLGYVMIVDDFGTGYSNSSRVKSIDFSGIKIDMSLVRAHFQKPDPYLPNLVKSLHDLGFTITAEGVEKETMARELCAMGCDYFQGFYYSRPIPMDEFLKKYGK